jgi:CHAT domain-containing protein
MRDSCPSQRTQRASARWHHPSNLVLLLATVALGGCHSSIPSDPAATFQDIRTDFVHGNLYAAQQKAEKAQKDFASAGADWPMKFRLLEAEVLTYRGRRPEVVALLNSPGISYPVSGDLAIKRYLLSGVAHATLGQAKQADMELQQAQQLSDAGNSDLNGELLQSEAAVQLYRDHLAEATDLAGRSLKAARDRRDSFLEAGDLLNLGLISIQTRHYDEALELLNQAAEIARPIQARLILEVALGNLGLAYFHLGDFEKALSFFPEAELEAKNIGTASLQVDWLMDAASSYYKLGNYQEAKTCFEQALNPALALHAPAEIADIETDLAFLLYRQGEFDAAAKHDEQALHAASLSGDKGAELEPLFLQALLTSEQKNGRDAERMMLQVYGRATEDPSLRGQIENALAKLYVGKGQAKRADLWYRKSIRTFEDQRDAVSNEELRLSFFANGDALYHDYADFLIVSKKQEQALQLLDIGRARTLAEGLEQKSSDAPERPVEVEAVARKLDGSILFYSLGEAKSYLWSVSSHQTRLFTLPGRAAIAAQVKSYQRAILKSSDPLREVNASGRSLYQTLVEPVAASIPKGSKVFIISDGILSELNFETLLTPEADQPHYWIEDVTISNANSIRLLSKVNTGINTGSSVEDAKKLLVIGNPVAGGTGYESLINAFAEIRGLEKHFPPDSRTVITQSEATPASYTQSQPAQFEYIHFVAHGTASQLSPLDSAVVLSASPGNPDKFKLYAREIMRSPLHAKLVTISSCYGSGLRSYAGEGLVGLSWAFLRAGSHNVIGALWEVSDASTPLLMDRLYGELAAGQSPDAALRTAKLSLIHTPAVFRKPLYWGAFQLYTGS